MFDDKGSQTNNSVILGLTKRFATDPSFQFQSNRISKTDKYAERRILVHSTGILVSPTKYNRRKRTV